MKRTLGLLLCLCSLYPIFPNSGDNTLAAFSPKPIKILFVGNSLTYTNQLPLLVEKEAKEHGLIVHTSLVAYPNYAIEDHWNDGKVRQLLEKERYDFLILQQGPSSLAEGRQMLLDYGAKFKSVCEAQQTQLVFYMVWPSLRYYQSFDKVIQNYTNAAQSTDALLCPVGSVWKAYIEQTKDRSYYGPDGFHPSEKGSTVAAQVIVKTLFPEITANERP